eukprot:scaffold4838_cov110-Cylindrotheca_fusiformis.AAC.3
MPNLFAKISTLEPEVLPCWSFSVLWETDGDFCCGSGKTVAGIWTDRSGWCFPRSSNNPTVPSRKTVNAALEEKVKSFQCCFTVTINEMNSDASLLRLYMSTALVGVGAAESGSPELGTSKSNTAASSLLLEADREYQIPVMPPVTPQVIDAVTSSPTKNTRLQGAKRSYLEVASSS